MPLRRHRAFVAVVAVALVGLWALSPTHFFWLAIPLLFLTLGLLRHARWHRRGYWRGGWPDPHQGWQPGRPPWART